MIATLSRELTKIRRNLQGIRTMNRLPDALVVVDPKREYIAVKEAQRMGIATVALIDTDSDPDPVDLPIPGNDDSIRSIEVVVGKAANAVLEGKAAQPAEDPAKGKPRGGGGMPPSRGGDGGMPPSRGGEGPGPQPHAPAVAQPHAPATPQPHAPAGPPTHSPAGPSNPKPVGAVVE
jgi:small subunit ribosomal protein S2